MTGSGHSTTPATARGAAGREADGRGSRATRRRARTRERILDIAEEAFTRSGYREVRMDDLAASADVAVGSLYSHFGSKEGLQRALAERALEQMGAYMDAAYQSDFSPLEQVLAGGDAYLRFHLEHPGMFHLLATSTWPLHAVNSEQADRLDARLAEIMATFDGVVADAIEAGEIDPAYRPELVTRFLWGAWNGVIALHQRPDRLALTDDAISECLLTGRRMVNDGLARPGFRDADGYSRARLRDTGGPAPAG